MTQTDSEDAAVADPEPTVNLSFEEDYDEDIEGEQTVTFVVTEDL